MTQPHHLLTLAWLALAFSQAARGQGLATPSTSSISELDVHGVPVHFCQLAEHNFRPSTPLDNSARARLQDLLDVDTTTLHLTYTSLDMQALGVRRVLDILAKKPRSLSRLIDWSERADLSRAVVMANFSSRAGKKLHIEVAGYQVCVTDQHGEALYFRDVDIDVWP